MSEDINIDPKFVFGGREYHLRPKFETIAAVEAVTNQPSSMLARKCYGGRLTDPLNLPNVDPISLTELGAIIYTILRMEDPKDHPNQTRIGEILMEDGYADLREPLGDYLARAMRGHKAHEAAARAEAAEAERRRIALEQEGAGALKPPADPPQDG